MLGVFLDQETTGLDSTKHSVIEVAFQVVDLASGKQQGAYSQVISITKKMWDERDPISIMINGFSYEEIAQGQERDIVSQQIQKVLTDTGVRRGEAVFICQNPSFDRPFFAQLVEPYTQEKLFWPYHWLDLASMYWALQVAHWPQDKKLSLLESDLSKDAIAKAVSLPNEQKPHRAMRGVDHLVLCYQKIVGFPDARRTS
jgi:oligoribonuclease